MSSLMRRFYFVFLFAAAALSCSGSTSESPDPNPLPATVDSLRLETTPPEKDWSFLFGVAVISDSDVHEILAGGFDRAEGDAGGELYLFMVNWTARRFEIPFRERVLKPQFEPYAALTLAHENDGSLFPEYKGGAGFRWVDFPWNRWVRTTFFVGLGLSYSSRIYEIDRERHPGEERSHLKVDWPIQFTFALPRWPQHQLVIFNDHKSGGHVFDEGGVNSVGLGYRFEF
ncbi:MAG TPA: hypothetical protein VEH04_11895 [Verrucomicrobiae bacterium]|nr:hypothetical protein [Verrucomicrobiae bacterium]